MPKRKSEIALFSLLMCVLVIFIHVTSWTLTAMDRTSVKYLLLLFPWRLSAFVVQGFVFLSGVRLFLSAKPFAYGQFLRGRVRRILLPYLVWVAVYYAYFIRIGWYRFSFRDLAEYVFLGTLSAALFYLLRSAGVWRLAGLLPLLIASPWVLLCAPLLLLYSGERGRRGGKYFFYFFYPAHFLLLQLLGKWIATALA